MQTKRGLCAPKASGSISILAWSSLGIAHIALYAQELGSSNTSQDVYCFISIIVEAMALAGLAYAISYFVLREFAQDAVMTVISVELHATLIASLLDQQSARCAFLNFCRFLVASAKGPNASVRQNGSN